MTMTQETTFYEDSTIASARVVLRLMLIATACLIADAVVGLRGDDVGTDTHAYAGVFLAMRNGFIATRFEPGFVLLTRLCSAAGMSVEAYPGRTVRLLAGGRDAGVPPLFRLSGRHAGLSDVSHRRPDVPVPVADVRQRLDQRRAPGHGFVPCIRSTALVPATPMVAVFPFRGACQQSALFIASLSRLRTRAAAQPAPAADHCRGGVCGVWLGPVDDPRPSPSARALRRGDELQPGRHRPAPACGSTSPCSRCSGISCPMLHHGWSGRLSANTSTRA